MGGEGLCGSGPRAISLRINRPLGDDQPGVPARGWQLPSIATSAVVGILINLIFLIFPPERYVPAARMAETRAK